MFKIAVLTVMLGTQAGYGIYVFAPLEGDFKCGGNLEGYEYGLATEPSNGAITIVVQTSGTTACRAGQFRDGSVSGPLRNNANNTAEDPLNTVAAVEEALISLEP